MIIKMNNEIREIKTIQDLENYDKLKLTELL
jgi:hypothetical protein